MNHILSTNKFTKDQVESILARAHSLESSYKDESTSKLLSDKVIACVFFEPSTRTRLSFETAALRLGAKVISVENAMESSSAYKGETIEDTARMLSCYADAIVIRHPTPFSVEKASKATETPILNAGDGANQHPSQGLLDLYTIQKEHGKLNDLNIIFVGDVLHSRTLNSLIPLFSLYSGITLEFVSPKELVLSAEQKKELTDRNISFKESDNLVEALPSADVIYMIRVQKERFASEGEYDKVKDTFILKPEHLNVMKEDAIIMHPLPRINEIDTAIDTDKRAAYFRQAGNAVYVRMALFLHVFNL
mgnify:CR=1 FL=1